MTIPKVHERRPIPPVPPHSEELEAMSEIDRKWQRGTTFLLTGIIIGVFDILFGLLFIPSDIRAGSDFWIALASAETFLAIVFIATGFVMKHQASLERALERQK